MNEKLLNRFNRVLKIYTKEDIALYLQDFFEEDEIEGFVDMLENRFNEFVVEFNIQSACGTKSYSATIIPKEKFGQEMFDDMISHKQFAEYYLEQNLTGERRNNKSVVYDRAWVRTDKTLQEFLEYLEDRL